MIFDSLEKCSLYYGVNTGFEKAFEFIKKAVNENLPVGKYEIDGDDIYASVQEYNTKSPEDGMFEAHRVYIDVQYVVSGAETIEVVDISKASVKKEYSREIEAAFYENSDKAGKCVLESGDWAIFYPHDLHKPGLAFDGKSTPVKKIVVKVKI